MPILRSHTVPDTAPAGQTAPAGPVSSLREHDECTQLMVLGEIDVATADWFAEELERAVGRAQARRERLVLDLTGVEFLGVIGIRILERHHDAVTAILVTHQGPTRAALARSRLRTRLVYRAAHHSPTATVPRPRPHN